MRFLSLAAFSITSLLRLAASQDLSSLPTCAVSCAVNAIGSTGCAVTDALCICQATSFLSGVQTCISTACNATDQAATLQFALQFCSSAGVTITLPTAPGSVPPAGQTSSLSPATTTASSPAVTTSSSAPEGPTPESSAPPAATFTGAAAALKQEWAGIAGVVGLGIAAIL